MTFNIRGLGGGPKRNSLCSLFCLLKPDILFIQETMTTAWKACRYFLTLFPGWEVSAIDASGRLRGLLCLWNPSFCDFRSFTTTAGLLLIGRVKGMEEELKLLNVYGPYRDRISFWNRLAGCGLLNDPNLILAGDLNLTLSHSEVWGTDIRDPLADHFTSLFTDAGLVDMKPLDTGPTWRNGWLGDEGISKT